MTKAEEYIERARWALVGGNTASAQEWLQKAAKELAKK